jgi:transcriptional regulator GlxA family with amidase domain
MDKSQRLDLTLSVAKRTPTPGQHGGEIGILAYPNSQAAAVHGLTDLFCVANSIHRAQGGTSVGEIVVSHWKLSEVSGRIARAYTTCSGRSQKFAGIILPPSIGVPETSNPSRKRLCRWLKARHAQGTALCSVCAGAFLLAETGLLNGRTATTHWSHAHELKCRFPNIKIEIEKLLIDHGDVFTAGGVMAWIDLGLRWIEKLMSPTVMLAAARFFVVDPPRLDQRLYAAFCPNLLHGDAQVLQLQHWIHSKYSEELTVAALAKMAAIGERTFLRRFYRATGLRPSEYFQQVRVTRAQEALEFSTHTVEEITSMVGYHDISAFRQVFKKVVGITPAEYRVRFGLTGRHRAQSSQ